MVNPDQAIEPPAESYGIASATATNATTTNGVARAQAIVGVAMTADDAIELVPDRRIQMRWCAVPTRRIETDVACGIEMPRGIPPVPSSIRAPGRIGRAATLGKAKARTAKEQGH